MGESDLRDRFGHDGDTVAKNKASKLKGLNKTIAA
jgi:hypothetical protein